MFGRLTHLERLTKFAILYSLILIFTGCSNVKNIRPEATTPNIQSSITVMTFNIRFGCGREKLGEKTFAFLSKCTKKYDKIVAAIRSVDPDVVGLQEVNADGASLIAKALNMNYAYRIHGPGYRWGNAVLTKFKLMKSKRISIGGAGTGNRSMVSAIGLVNDKTVAFTSIHVDHKLPGNTSIKKILGYLNSLTEPAILIGDFNIVPGSSKAKMLLDGTGLIDSATAGEYGHMGTWGGPYGKRIDYVFIQSKYFNALDAALVSPEHQYASDHIAYYTVLDMK